MFVKTFSATDYNWFVKIMSIIIHIGYPKTASTWFQDEYFPEIENYDYLVDRWLFYKLIFESDSLLYNPEFTRDQVKKI